MRAPGGATRAPADLALDVGTWELRVAARGRGVVLREPSVVVLQEGATGRAVVAVGAKAAALAGQAGHRLVRPVRGGAVEDWAALEHLVRDALARHGLAQGQGRVLVAVPGDATETERRALDASLRAAGAKAVRRVDAALAAAVGAQLPVGTPTGSMVVSVGAGRTEATLVAAHGVAARRVVRVAGEAMDAALVHWLRRLHHVLLTGAGAEQLKLDVGAARLPSRPLRTRLQARDLGTGQPLHLDVDAAQVVEALKEPVQRIVSTCVDLLREASPELCADVLERGMLLVGGAARLRELDAVLRDATEVPCLLADEPELATARGLARLLDDPTLLALLEDEPSP